MNKIRITFKNRVCFIYETHVETWITLRYAFVEKTIKEISKYSFCVFKVSLNLIKASGSRRLRNDGSSKNVNRKRNTK